jgi:two-component system, chemotaxis family, sensor kinase Cph1
MPPDDFARFYGTMPEAMLLIGARHEVVAANRAALEFFRGLAGPPLGKRLEEITAEPEGKLRTYLRSALRSAEWTLGSVGWLDASGGVTETRCEGALFRGDSEGAGPAVVLRLTPREPTVRSFIALNEKIEALALEVHQRKEAEEQLRAQREWLRTTLASIGDGVVATDSQGRVQFMNPIAERLTGWSQMEAAGRPLDEVFRIVNEFSRGSVENPVAKVLREGVVVGLANHTILIARDGVERPIDDSGAPIRDTSGNILGVVLVFRDATESRRAEDALREREEYLRVALSAGRMGVWDWEIEKDRVRWSDTLASMMALPDGQPPTSVSEFLNLILPEDRPRIQAAIQEALTSDSYYDVEFRTLRPDGSIQWHSRKGRVLRNENGKPVRMIGVGLDITAQKSAQEELQQALNQKDLLLQANEELKQFTYAASHDLREPLRTISGYTQLLSRRYRDSFDEDALEFMSYIVNGVTRMSALIDGLLNYGRILNSGQPLRQVPAETALREALSSLGKLIEETSAEITSTELPEVNADQMQLAAVFQNLIGNSLKYRGAGTPRVHIGAERQGGHWVFSVTDNGIGIDPQYHETVFTIFKRLNPEPSSGVGIGLALCRKVVELHGGRIWVDSEQGRGSTFFFSLPIRQTEQSGALANSISP